MTQKLTLKLLGIVFLSSLPFLFSLHGDFVFDDSEAIIKNKDILSESWFDCFYNDFWGTNIKSNLSHKSYRPLTVLSFRLQYFLNGRSLSPFQFKVANLVCHIICCILVWQAFESMTKTLCIPEKNKYINTAYLASVVFAVHPVHVEAICGIVGRADILAAITFFLSFIAYNKAITTQRVIYLSAAILLAAVSMLFKENGVTVLGFCLCYEIVAKLQMKNITKQKNNYKYKYLHSMLRIVVTIVSIILLLYGRWILMGSAKPDFKPTDNPTAFSENIYTKAGTYNYIYFLNSLLFIWPQWLCYDWSMGCIPIIRSTLDYRITLIILMFTYVVLILIAILNKQNKESFKSFLILAIVLIVVPFLPAANILYPVGFVIAERILYIPSAGYCLLLTLGVNKIIARGETIKKMVFIFFLLLIFIYLLRCWQRSFDWQNEYQLFISGLSVCPLNAKVHYNVAKVADAANQTEWAIAEYKESIRLYPEYYQALNNLANLFKNQKQFPEAESYLRTALKYKQDFSAAWMNLGIVLASTNRFTESENAYKNALKYRKNYPDCYYNLGNLYLSMNKTQNAIENWTQAIHLNSKHVLAWINLLALLDNTENIETAKEFIPRAIAELPDSPSVLFAIANIYGKMERYTEAEEHFLKSIKLFGDRVQAIHYSNLGVLYHRWRKYNLAEQMYKKALTLNPVFASAHKNIKSLQKLKNKLY
ncbi:protein O-mannosyl-transferase TMTC4-like [Galleria mellonella]|uniref:dolichyl-phosphate-mannose--protein mannosyltransferase n=1 Tax=Galleria mellonella TaxID=7137 RepID=A0A6J1X4H6_GALME|nr:protein O-mannosyl-transferase TMTC4-like [Galleria mellonella]